jgi:hypothetical protein
MKKVFAIMGPELVRDAIRPDNSKKRRRRALAVGRSRR